MSDRDKIAKLISAVETSLEKHIQNNQNEAILNEYQMFLQNETQILEQNQQQLKLIKTEQENIDSNLLQQKLLELQKQIETYTNQLSQINEEYDNLTIAAIAEKELLKIEQAEKEQQILSFYESEKTKALNDLKISYQECDKSELDIKNQIDLELATRNARLSQMKMNLKQQIADKNNDYSKELGKTKELKRKLDELKSREEQLWRQSNKQCIVNFENNSINNVLKYNETSNQQRKFNVISNLSNVNYKNPTQFGQISSNTTCGSEQNLMGEYEQFERNFNTSTPILKDQGISNLHGNRAEIGSQLPREQFRQNFQINVLEEKEDPAPNNMDSFETRSSNSSIEDITRKLPTIYSGKGFRKYYQNFRKQ